MSFLVDPIGQNVGQSTDIHNVGAVRPHKGRLDPASQFEALLITKMLNDLQHAYAIPGAEDGEETSQQYRGFATEALGQELAARGGFGFAPLFNKVLDLSGEAKVAAQMADMRRG